MTNFLSLYPELSSIVRLLPPSLALAVAISKVLRKMQRWQIKEKNKTEAIILLEMQRLKNYGENPSTFIAACFQDLLFSFWMLVTCILTVWISSSPSQNFSDQIAAVFLVIEAVIAFGLFIFSFDKATKRIRQAKNPRQTELQHAFKLIQLRLEQQKAKILKSGKNSIEPNEKIDVQSLLKDLSPWVYQ